MISSMRYLILLLLLVSACGDDSPRLGNVISQNDGPTIDAGPNVDAPVDDAMDAISQVDAMIDALACLPAMSTCSSSGVDQCCQGSCQFGENGFHCTNCGIAPLACCGSICGRDRFGQNSMCVGAGECLSCGKANQLCCPNSQCDEGNCIDGQYCMTWCGGRGLPCCPGSHCAQGLVCQASCIQP